MALAGESEGLFPGERLGAGGQRDTARVRSEAFGDVHGDAAEAIDQFHQLLEAQFDVMGDGHPGEG